MEEYLATGGEEAELSEAHIAEVAYEGKGAGPKLRDPLGPEKARDVIAALGGPGNIVKVESCAETRLRVKIVDPGRVDEPALIAAGIQGYVDVGEGTLHLLAGLNADQYAGEMRGQLAEPVPA
jgi:glucose PTS system EIICB or EIICBA component